MRGCWKQTHGRAASRAPGSVAPGRRQAQTEPGKYYNFICYIDSSSEWVWWPLSLHGVSKVGTIVSTSPGRGRGRRGQASLGQEHDCHQPQGCETDGAASLQVGPSGWLRGGEIQCPVRGTELALPHRPGGGGQGCSASSRSSCLKRFLEARLGRSRRRQAGRHWSRMLCRGQGGAKRPCD